MSNYERTLWTQWRAHAVVAHPDSHDVMHTTYSVAESAVVCGICATRDYHGHIMLPRDDGNFDFLELLGGDDVILMTDREYMQMERL